MVEIKRHKIWMCPVCREKYDSEEDANDCAILCTKPESALLHEEKDVYICKYCDEEFSHKKQAQDCETEHLNKQDKWFEQYHDKKSKEKLSKASKHPNQLKLEV